MPRVPESARTPLDWLAADQDDVVTRRQLGVHGYDADAANAQFAARRWQPIGRRVIVLHNGPLTIRQQRWAAVLSQHAAALGGLTAAAEHGLTGFDVDEIHVLVEYGARLHPLPGVELHVSRRFIASLNVRPSLPVVEIERALVDAAAWTAAPRKACAILVAGVQQRLTTPERLRTELAAAGRIRHRRLLVGIVDDIAGGAESFGEIDFGRLAKRAGLPPPLRQAFRLDRASRRRWLDADFGTFCVEIDGAVHLRPLRYWDDMERQNDLLLVTGKPMLRFSTVAIRLAPRR